MKDSSKSGDEKAAHSAQMRISPVRIPVGSVTLDGDLAVPAGAKGLVLFAHGTGSSRHSPRNRFVARTLQDSGIGTLLFDLLTRKEEAEDDRDGHLRFDIDLLATRLGMATRWAARDAGTRSLSIGYFGASTGGAAALKAAADAGAAGVDAIVSRGGRPDLAGAAILARVTSPTLLIVGGHDDVVIGLNETAYAHLRCPKALTVVPGATHLFEEPGALEQVASYAATWFGQYLKPR